MVCVRTDPKRLFKESRYLLYQSTQSGTLHKRYTWRRFHGELQLWKRIEIIPNDTIKEVIKETADNLCGRFNDTIGCIRSWDFGEWNYPVIIDNIMNLDLLFNAYNLTSNYRYNEVAIKHAKTTMRNHFRPDYTCYHVVSYNNDGTVDYKRTTKANTMNLPGHADKHGQSMVIHLVSEKPKTPYSWLMPRM